MACITANNSRGRRRTFGERDRNGDKRGRVEETRYTEHGRLEKFARNYDRTRGREKKSTSACKSRASCSLHALPFLALFCSVRVVRATRKPMRSLLSLGGFFAIASSFVSSFRENAVARAKRAASTSDRSRECIALKHALKDALKDALKYHGRYRYRASMTFRNVRTRRLSFSNETKRNYESRRRVRVRNYEAVGS